MNYRHRPGQEQMVELGTKFFENAFPGDLIAFKAPPGVGKTRAYVRALLQTQPSRLPPHLPLRTIIATATNSLLEQVAAELREHNIEPAILKGKARYPCCGKKYQLITVDECNDPASTPEEVENDDCPLGEKCEYKVAKSYASCAKYVVTNHSLLLIHFNYHCDLFGSNIDRVVIDEADELIRYAQSLPSRTWTKKGTDMRLRAIENRVSVDVDNARRIADDIAEELANCKPQQGANPAYAYAPLTERLCDYFAEFAGEMSRIKEDCSDLAESLYSRYEKETDELRDARLARDLAERAEDSAKKLIEKERWNYVIDKKAITEPKNYSYLIQNIGVPILACSATLTASHIENKWQLDCQHHLVQSSFSLPEQAELYIITEKPDKPKKPVYVQKVAQIVRKIIKDCLEDDEGMMLICRNREDRDLFAKALKDLGPLVHTSKSDIDEILLQFKAAPGLLIGCDAIGRGLDIPGKALSAVVIAGMPFPPPRTHPAIDDEIDNSGLPYWRGWRSYHYPDVCRRMEQWAGRLIRHEKDSGILVVYDGRCVPKDIGWGHVHTERYFHGEFMRKGGAS